MKSEGKKYKKERKLFLKYGKPTVQREQQNKELKTRRIKQGKIMSTASLRITTAYVNNRTEGVGMHVQTTEENEKSVTLF